MKGEFVPILYSCTKLSIMNMKVNYFLQNLISEYQSSKQEIMLFSVPFSRINVAKFSPLNRAMTEYNTILEKDPALDFAMSLNIFRKRVCNAVMSTTSKSK